MYITCKWIGTDENVGLFLPSSEYVSMASKNGWHVLDTTTHMQVVASKKESERILIKMIVFPII